MALAKAAVTPIASNQLTFAFTAAPRLRLRSSISSSAPYRLPLSCRQGLTRGAVTAPKERLLRLPQGLGLSSCERLGGQALGMVRERDADPAGKRKGRTTMTIAGFPRELVFAVAGPLIAGSISALSSDIKFYNQLQKPAWAPPPFLFGLVWPVLYALMGAASFLVWRDGGGMARQAGPLRLYAIQLGLNLAWQPLFFGVKSLGWALVDMVALLVTLIMTIAAFRPVSNLAANMLRPYLVWVVFAAALNYSIWKQSTPEGRASAV